MKALITALALLTLVAGPTFAQSVYSDEQGTAHNVSPSSSDFGDRPRSRQRGLCRDRHASAEAAGRSRHIEAAGVNGTPSRCSPRHSPNQSIALLWFGLSKHI